MDIIIHDRSKHNSTLLFDSKEEYNNYIKTLISIAELELTLQNRIVD